MSRGRAKSTQQISFCLVSNTLKMSMETESVLSESSSKELCYYSGKPRFNLDYTGGKGGGWK